VRVRRVIAVGGFDAEAAAGALAGTLRSLGTAERAAQEQRYLKSDLEFFGVTVPVMRRAVKAAAREHLAGTGRRGVRLDRDTAVAWALALWREPVFERRSAAVEVLRLGADSLTAGDLGVIEELLRSSRTWALVDPLSVDIAGAVALRDQASWPAVDQWAADADFWVRRSAVLALLPGVRAGRPDLARFTRYADAMLAEKEFFIRKALGWVLREISRADPSWVTAWTGARLATVSGVTFREAIRHLPGPDRQRLERGRPRAGRPVTR
jgi:3-methyladenine DNA glycosylase AlkD